jgi:hypothetical protein
MVRAFIWPLDVNRGVIRWRPRKAVNSGGVTTERRCEMKTYTLAGIILIVIGIAVLAYQGVTYTTREKVVDIGPIQMTAEKTKTFPLPPIVGGVALVGGIVLLVMGIKKGWSKATMTLITSAQILPISPPLTWKPLRKYPMGCPAPAKLSWGRTRW